MGAFCTSSSPFHKEIVKRIVRMLPALLLLLPVTFAIDCPEGWMGIHGSCYLTAPDKSMFFHAQEYCWEQGGYLAEIDTPEESEAVMGIISLELNYWIGLTDFADDGRWIWQESHQVANWTNWQEGEPNNLGGQDCVIMEQRYDHRWDDVYCDYTTVQEHAFCEREPLSA